MVREAAVAGQFYERDFDKLNKQIEACFQSKYGPGALPVKRTDKKIEGVIVPHAGYSYSGACAAWAFKEIAESLFPSVFLLIGPNHFGYGSGLSIEDWRTPFGIVRTDKDLVRGLKDNTVLKIAEQHHITEHSVEVQLPFLQFSNKDMLKNLRIAPIALGQDIDFDVLGKQIAQYLKKIRKRVVFIISSDFTHYGPHYGYVPFSSDIPSRINKLDQDAIDIISNLNKSGFRDYINKTGITICGFLPILTYLSFLEAFEEKPKVQLLMHYTSGDLMEDYTNSVSYASLIFK